jgi:hypothetical protein
LVKLSSVLRQRQAIEFRKTAVGTNISAELILGPMPLGSCSPQPAHTFGEKLHSVREYGKRMQAQQKAFV